MNIWPWFVETLRAYPELAPFLALAIGFWIGPKKLAGFSLGSVTATLLAAVAIGQLQIQVPGPIKSTFFLMFLFAVGYGVGPQFFQGLSKDGPKQILFSLVVLALCLLVPLLAQVSPGWTSGMPSDSTRGRRRSPRRSAWRRTRSTAGFPPDQAKAYLDAIPVGYAVTYIFGTIGSAVVLAQLGPKLLGVDLAAACADYEKQMGGGRSGHDPGVFSAYRRFWFAPTGSRRRAASRASPSASCSRASASSSSGSTAATPSSRPTPTACFSRAISSRFRARECAGREGRDGRSRSGGPRAARHAGHARGRVRAQQGRQRADAARAGGRAVHAGHLPGKITRNMVEMPMLPETEILRGDILTVGGSTRHVDAAVANRPRGPAHREHRYCRRGRRHY